MSEAASSRANGQSMAVGGAFAVVERELVDEEETFLAHLFVTAVPDGVDRQQVKEAIDKAGRVYGSDGRRWVNHTILPPEKWTDSVREDFQTKGGDLGVSFDELDAEARGEKRVTIRMEKSLHSLLELKAEQFDRSFNDYCTAVLGWAANNIDDAVLREDQEVSRLSQRDAMRALYRLCRGDKDACIENWKRLYRENIVAVGKHPELYPPETYGPQLWKDGLNKKWLTGKVSEEVVAFVRQRLQ